jgi:hypothetical protein
VFTTVSIWCEEIQVTNCSTPVLSTDTIRFRAASLPEDIIRGIIGVKSIGPVEKYWDSTCNVADNCNPLEVKDQRAAFRSRPLPCNNRDLVSLVRIDDTGNTPPASLADCTARLSRISRILVGATLRSLCVHRFLGVLLTGTN